LDKLKNAGFSSKENGKFKINEDGENKIKINWK
jgi:hypothetical protein